MTNAIALALEKERLATIRLTMLRSMLEAAGPLRTLRISKRRAGKEIVKVKAKVSTPGGVKKWRTRTLRMPRRILPGWDIVGYKIVVSKAGKISAWPDPSFTRCYYPTADEAHKALPDHATAQHLPIQVVGPVRDEDAKTILRLMTIVDRQWVRRDAGPKETP